MANKTGTEWGECFRKRLEDLVFIQHDRQAGRHHDLTKETNEARLKNICEGLSNY